MVHPTTLAGQEVRDELERHRTLWTELRLFSTHPDEIGTLTDVRGTAAVVQALDEDSLDTVDLVFFGGPLEDNRAALAQVPEGTGVVLLSPDAGPDDAVPVVAGVNLERERPQRRLLSPHPGAVLTSLLLQPLVSLGLEEAVITLIQPASMHDQPGIDELFDQTRRIVAFAEPSKNEIFRRQLAFNLLPARRPVEHIAPLIEAIVGPLPRVAVEVLQGGVFHGTSASLHLRFTSDPGAKAIRKALKAAPFLAAGGKKDLLGPIDSAARDEVLVGELRADAVRPGSYWLWAVMDNLTRGAALNAVAVARKLLGGE